MEEGFTNTSMHFYCPLIISSPFKHLRDESPLSGISPCARVGVGVPGLLLHSKGSLRQDGTEPGRDVFADVIDLVRVLARAAGAVLVRLVLQDLHATALAAALLSALFLEDQRGGGLYIVLLVFSQHVVIYLNG